MKKEILIIFLLLVQFNLKSQTDFNKSKLETIFIETLEKSRNAVRTASNAWRYDNSDDDYFSADTITLKSARSYRNDFCKEIYWSFYESKSFVINRVIECTEPPTRLHTKKSDSITLEIDQSENNLYFNLYNFGKLSECFQVIEVAENKPIYKGEEQFDYTIKLLRVE